MTFTSLEFRRGRRFVKRWPGVEVGEPAHGFLMRVALAHHQPSAAVFANRLSLYDSDDAEGCLRALSGSVLAERNGDDLKSLRRWTPLFTGATGVMNGETIRRDDWSNRYRKHCRACLAEKAFPRSWFDLTFVAVCPFHGTPVSDRLPDGTRAYFHSAEMTMTAGGIKVAVSAPRLVDTPNTIEAYALGRLGLMPRRPNPFLDAVTLGEVVEACEVMGRLVEKGWLRNTPEPVGTDAGAATETKAAGYGVLTQGPEAARDLFRSIADQAPPATFGTKRLFGWASANFAQRGGFCGQLQRLMADVAVDLGRSARRAETRAASAVAEAMTMAEVAAEVGQTIDVVTAIAADLGLMLPHKGGTGTPFLMPRLQLSEIRAALQRSVTRSEAAAMLRVSYDTFLEIARACDIPKVGSRWGQRKDGQKVGFEDRFDREVIKAFLDRIPNEPLTDFEMADMPAPWPTPITVSELLEVTRYDVADFFRAVFAGYLTLERTGQDKGLEDFELWPNLQPLWHPFTKRCMSGMATRGNRASDGMPVREATALLEIEPTALKIMMADGLFGGEPGDKRQNRLDRHAVVAFFQRYAVAKVYAGALECTNAEAIHLLRKRGLKPALTVTDPKMATGKQNLAYFFERAEVRAALGLAADPEATDASRIVWKRLSAFLGQNQSAFSIWRIKGQTAALSTFNKLWPIEVSYDFPEEPRLMEYGRDYTYSIRAQLVIEGTNFANRRDELLEVLRQRSLWPGIEIHEEVARLSVAITVQYLHYGLTPEVSEQGMDFIVRYGADEVEVIERMLHMLKGGLEPSDRPFDLRTFGGWEALRYRPWGDDEDRVHLVKPETLFRLTG